ncbi:hypothetical protein [Streptomyces sp. 1331.2]|uniref:hypothetical protein n=1 Tax=Streptomyces sp. 1331.2 TaxID=1938835 RepID=UPI000BCB43A7|nr:hypothetical protein [Streptomyces sp. 1331.2]SOB81651.1 hypothetical protein SAMN06272789_1788 [Streptomyces sp. 1331.2]
MHYQREDFLVDGALRDLCILDANVEDWQRIISSLSSSEWEVSFTTTLSEESPGVLANARELFETLAIDGEASATLAILVDGIWFTCYFFDMEEVEFTFDPGDVSDETSFRSVERFMKWLGDTCERRVIMTMEGTDHRSMPALLEYAPA